MHQQIGDRDEDFGGKGKIRPDIFIERRQSRHHKNHHDNEDPDHRYSDHRRVDQGPPGLRPEIALFLQIVRQLSEEQIQFSRGLSRFHQGDGHFVKNIRMFGHALGQ